MRNATFSMVPTALGDRSRTRRCGDVLLEMLRRGVVGGGVGPTALSPRAAAVGPDLLFLHYLLHGSPICDEVPAEIVDDVLLPLVRPL